ncbi:SdpI family protein [Cryomorpha ignava]|uniref:SdpI family protein n=2 Tax=Cryomorpha ignava TaxID=101383 RepID=A0A7K3WP18_9FLAO|nr:SdpI family protein [Cryomorpha ignava]
MDHNIINAMVFVSIAIIFVIFRPKKMNGLFGYRTPRSKKNLSNWNYAQRLSSSLLLIFTSSIFVLTLFPAYIEINFNVVVILILPSFILTILIVEYKLWRRDN